MGIATKFNEILSCIAKKERRLEEGMAFTGGFFGKGYHLLNLGKEISLSKNVALI